MRDIVEYTVRKERKKEKKNVKKIAMEVMEYVKTEIVNVILIGPEMPVNIDDV